MAIYLSKAQFSLAILKSNSHWQHQNSIFIGNIKAQFSLAIFKAQFSLAISKPNSHWQNQSPILIGNIKVHFTLAKSKFNSYWQHQNPILIGNIKAQFSLALFCQKRAQDYQYLAKKKYHGKILPWQKPWQLSYKKTHWELS